MHQTTPYRVQSQDVYKIMSSFFPLLTTSHYFRQKYNINTKRKFQKHVPKLLTGCKSTPESEVDKNFQSGYKKKRYVSQCISKLFAEV